MGARPLDRSDAKWLLLSERKRVYVQARAINTGMPMSRRGQRSDRKKSSEVVERAVVGIGNLPMDSGTPSDATEEEAG